MLNGLGYKTNIDLDELVNVGNWISDKLGRQTNSRAGAALTVARNRKANLQSKL